MNQFKAGVLSTGIDVINIGIVPTPVNYFSMFHLGYSLQFKLQVVIIHLDSMVLNYQ